MSNHKGNPANDLVVFDLDGTLISSYMDNDDRNYHNWRVIPGRPEKIAALQRINARIAIVTNQAGVAFGHVTESDFLHKINAVMIALNIGRQFWHVYDYTPDTARRCNIGMIPIFVCYGHARATDQRYALGHERRKPAPAMIEEAMRLHDTLPEHTLMVGDRPEDEAAARAAGCAYVDRVDYFAHAATLPTPTAAPACAPVLRPLHELYRDSHEHE